jgi:LmbE family N-acetylglucosaminyl deacetylase
MFWKQKYKYLNIDNLVFNTTGKTKVLFIFPHPDDEVMLAGGLIHALAKDQRFEIKVLTATVGEKGTEKWKLPPQELGKARKQEFINCLKVLGTDSYEIWNMGDGELRTKEVELQQKLTSYFAEFSPNLVVTYEKYGVYGHPDHIALSKAVTAVHQKSGQSFSLLYATIPGKLLKHIGMPTHMADSKEIFPTEPELKFFLGKSVWTKFKASRQHRSQNLMGGIKVMFWPLMRGYEYYTTNYPK